VLRTLHHAILDGALYFHGDLRGQKRGLIGRSVVFGCEEVVAQIPSYWKDPRLACPATTWFRSAQAHGQLERVNDSELKARAMTALMDRLQPEGGFVPISAESKEYKKFLGATAVFRLVPTHLMGRYKVGQNKSPADIQVVLKGLWQRGTDQDLRAIEIILAENSRAERPSYLRGPGETELLVHPSAELAKESALLLQNQYWNGDYDLDQLAQSQTAAPAWIGVRDQNTGRLVGTGAAISNTHKRAFIYDVVIESAYRGRGLGAALVRALLNHPRLRSARTVALGTRDAGTFYGRFRFVEEQECLNPLGVTTMIRRR
jgi:ribosomal protein S18 acetylase RimI-like enzyme/nitroimidazol reductase NimA-like FMN-containing flavoprotein (pyridoxamine 5'-phosphate oxidase superfamily)